MGVSPAALLRSLAKRCCKDAQHSLVKSATYFCLINLVLQSQLRVPVGNKGNLEFPPGARVVIFLDQGRQSLAQHRRENPDLLFADLPSRSSLEKAADGSKFEMAEFVDESSLYLAVLLFQG
uniref:Uncharacterized protein n=1 Tax=Aegilops tauschii TaxID=37682 RepID=M8C9M0_AEGTA